MSYGMVLSGARGRTAAMTERVVRTTEISAAALAVSMASVRLGGANGKKVAGFPLELVAGSLLYAASAMGAGGPRFSDDLLNFADGCLAAYFTTQGRVMGAQGAGVSGYEIGNGGLTPEAEQLLRAAGLMR